MTRSTVLHVLVFGALGGVLIAALKWLEYRWLVATHAAELYAGAVAILFAAIGLVLGRKLTRPHIEIREIPVEVPMPMPAPASFTRDEQRQAQLGLTAREIDMLEQMAAGLSNREIAARSFVSENTVKTHLSRIYEKLDARRRTQAVQRAREWRLIA